MPNDHQSTIDEWEIHLGSLFDHLIKKARVGRANLVDISRVNLFNAIDDFEHGIYNYYRHSIPLPKPEPLPEIQINRSTFYSPLLSNERNNNNGRSIQVKRRSSDNN